MASIKIPPAVAKELNGIFSKLIGAVADVALDEVQTRLRDGADEVDGRISRARRKVQDVVKPKKPQTDDNVIEAEFVETPKRRSR